MRNISNQTTKSNIKSIKDVIAAPPFSDLNNISSSKNSEDKKLLYTKSHHVVNTSLNIKKIISDVNLFDIACPKEAFRIRQIVNKYPTKQRRVAIILLRNRKKSSVQIANKTIEREARCSESVVQRATRRMVEDCIVKKIPGLGLYIPARSVKNSRTGRITKRGKEFRAVNDVSEFYNTYVFCKSVQEGFGAFDFSMSLLNEKQTIEYNRNGNYSNFEGKVFIKKPVYEGLINEKTPLKNNMYILSQSINSLVNVSLKSPNVAKNEFVRGVGGLKNKGVRNVRVKDLRIKQSLEELDDAMASPSIDFATNWIKDNQKRTILLSNSIEQVANKLGLDVLEALKLNVYPEQALANFAHGRKNIGKLASPMGYAISVLNTYCKANNLAMSWDIIPEKIRDYRRPVVKAEPIVVETINPKPKIIKPEPTPEEIAERCRNRKLFTPSSLVVEVPVIENPLSLDEIREKIRGYLNQLPDMFRFIADNLTLGFVKTIERCQFNADVEKVIQEELQVFKKRT